VLSFRAARDHRGVSDDDRPRPPAAADERTMLAGRLDMEEYARHNGHADLLRERIDGATGE
jgi:Protein of unknown function (DUF664)